MMSNMSSIFDDYGMSVALLVLAAVSLVLLFVCLMTGIVKVEQVEDVADFLQKNMAFFFVPMCANILEELEILKSTGLLLLGVCVFCTVVTFAVTGFTVTLLQKLMNGKEKKRYLPHMAHDLQVYRYHLIRSSQ